MRLFDLKTITMIFMLFGLTTLKASTTTATFIKYPNEFFIETGTWDGHGVQMAIDAGFKRIYSIELKESCYHACCSRFASVPFIKLLLGDSGDILPLVLEEIDAPATFWLDGHYCGEGSGKGKTNTPLLQELEHISKHPIKTHTILIDDIRMLGSNDLDFITLDTVKEKLLQINPDYEFVFENGHEPNDVLVAIVKNK